jgi:hypothetical protein
LQYDEDFEEEFMMTSVLYSYWVQCIKMQHTKALRKEIREDGRKKERNTLLYLQYNQCFQKEFTSSSLCTEWY